MVISARGSRTNSKPRRNGASVSRKLTQLSLALDSTDHGKNSDHESAGPTRFAAAEFFAGIGLVRLALEQEGIRVAFANDIDPDKQHLYEQNFDARDFCLGDIHELAAKDLPDCDLFTASFPCNDLSIAGSMKGLNAGQSSAFWGLVDLVKGLKSRRPSVVLLENVPGFLMSDEGRDLEKALLALNELGYAVDAIMVDASNFVPQSRLRLFIVAKLGVAGRSYAEMPPSELRPRALAEFIVSHPDIRWDVIDLPPIVNVRKPLKSVIENLPDDHPAWWSEKRVAYFMSQLSERHHAMAKSMIDAKTVSYGTAFRRVRHGRSMAELRTDGVAGCLRTPRGGSGRQILFKAGKGRYQVRLLSARECARLQGVPDDYKIDVPLNKALFGFGDAVCVPAVAWIAKHYLLPELTRLSSRRNQGCVEE